MWYGTTKTRFLASISLLTLLLLCYMTVSRMTSTWYFCGGRVLQCQFISSSWGFLSMVTPWFVSNIDNTSIGIETSLKWIFQGFWLQVQNSYFNQPFDGCFLQYLGGKTIFWKTWIPSEKPVYAPVYSLFEILSKENYLKNCKEGCSGGRVLQQIFRLGLC